MIISALSGGLGNQMFQYACGRAMAKKLGKNLLLDTSWFGKTHKNTTLRSFDLHAFPSIQCRFATKKEISAVGPARTLSSKVIREVRKLIGLGKANKSTFVREPSLWYWKEIEGIHAPVYLSGYWQSEKYFLSCADDIRADFTFPELVSNDAKKIADSILSCSNSVSIHIRRGDYVSNVTAAALMGQCSAGYYRSSLEYLKNLAGDDLELFLFSDDLDWVRNNFDTLGLPSTVVDVPDYRGAWWHEMHLMSLCKHQIIANSTFSWWAAWLSQGKGSVIGPRSWFVAPHLADYNPCAEGWDLL